MTTGCHQTLFITDTQSVEILGMLLASPDFGSVVGVLGPQVAITAAGQHHLAVGAEDCFDLLAVVVGYPLDRHLFLQERVYDLDLWFLGVTLRRHEQNLAAI